MSAQLHRCDTCGAEGEWTAKWRWFGSYDDLEEMRPIRKFCGVACYDAVEGGLAERAPWVDLVRWREVCALSDDAARVLKEVSDFPDQFPGEVAHASLREEQNGARFVAALAELERAKLVRRVKSRRRSVLVPVGEYG